MPGSSSGRTNIKFITIGINWPLCKTMTKFLICILFISGCTNSSNSMDAVSVKTDTLPEKKSILTTMFKTINYQGGLVSFKIPENWVEHLEENGGGTFYEDTPNSGTLRVNVLTLSNKQASGNPLDDLKDGQKKSDQKEYSKDNGDKVLEYVERTKENDIPITIFTFICSHKTTQKEFLVAIFTWTIETRFEKQDNHIREWNMIQTQLQQVKFGR